MLRKHFEDVPAIPITKEGFREMTARFALTKEDGCPNYAMRIMEFAPGGCTSLHAHPEEHEFFFLEGDAAIVGGCGTETRLQAGDFAYVRSNEPHQIRNLGATPVRVICTIPILPGGDGKSTIAQRSGKDAKERESETA
jgi:quercetin dioxygenase-like cupin family protein